jgi:glucose/arabinose dehydrogenase
MPSHASSPPPRRFARALAALLCGCLLSLAGAAHAIQLPQGFVSETLPFVFDVPTALCFLPDGRLLVAEKGGIVYLVDGDQRHSLWVHEEEVLNTDDRGLLAVSVDPDYATNRRIYFLLTVDPDSNGIELDNYDDAFARLVRYQVGTGIPNVVLENTRTTLIGATWREGFASGSGTHTIGALEWGADGSLLVSAGDGAHFEVLDPGGLDPGLFAPGRTDSSEDIGAFRSQDLNSLDGKILRVDPATGLGLPSNPFFDGDPSSHRSRVWAYGLRNPFRVTRRPGTGSSTDPGTLYLGDVGWSTWEEVNVANAPGRNFGWPCFEGVAGNADYQAASPTHHGCSTLGTPDNPSLPTPPIAAFHHHEPAQSVPAGTRGGVVAGGRFYTGTSYPVAYHGGYFFGDYGRGWIKVMKTDANDDLVELMDFAVDAEGPVAFAVEPTSGDLFYISIDTGQVRRIRYVGAVDVPSGPSAGGLRLSPPSPNPSRGTTTLSVELPEPANLRFAVFDVTGREVWAAPDRGAPAGRSQLTWAGLGRDGRPVPTGLYLARVEAGGLFGVRRMIVVR